MLDWLQQQYDKYAPGITNAIRTWVLNIIYAVIGVQQGIDERVNRAWQMMYQAGVDGWTGLTAFAQGVGSYFYMLRRHYIPDIWRRIAYNEHDIWSGLARWVHYLHVLINKNHDLIIRTSRDDRNWATRYIYDPLHTWVEYLNGQLKKYLYPVWYYISHPQALADLIYFNLLYSFERNWFATGLYLGRWLFQQVMVNALPDLQLIEKLLSEIL